MKAPKCRSCGNEHYGTCAAYFAANTQSAAPVDGSGGENGKGARRAVSVQVGAVAVTDTQQPSVTAKPSVTDRRRQWEATNAEKHRKQSADRMKKRRAAAKA